MRAHAPNTLPCACFHVCAICIQTALRLVSLDTLAISDKTIRESLRSAGKIRLLVLGGFFTSNAESDLDILLVGDKLDTAVVDTAITKMEAEYGKEVHYAVLTTEEYQFRTRVRDKLLRDLMDFTHRKVVDLVQV